MGEWMHGGRMIARVLKQEGVECLFALTGGHIAPILDGCVSEGIRVIDVRHEQAAAHAADAWARVTGIPGACAVTAGPGVTDAFTGVANAMYANSPLICFGGRALLSEELRGGLQEMDHVAFMREVTQWSRTCWETRRLAEYTGIAFRQALAGRGGPVFLDIPMDLLMNGADEDAAFWPDRSRHPNRPGGDPDLVAEAARLLGDAERPVIFAGAGTRWAECSAELDELSRVLDAPVLLNSLGRGMLPSDHSHLMPNGRRHALGNADVVLALGIEWDFRIGFGRKGIHPEARIIQIDMDNREIGRNRPVDVGITGHIRTVLRQLLTHDADFGSVSDRPWRKEVRDADLAEQDKMDKLAMSDESPVHPHRFAREIRDWLSERASEGIVVGDGGDIVATAAKWVRVNKPGHWLDPGPFGCLGVGMPFALAAKAARPETPVTIIYGDGSFGLNGMEYDTAIRHQLPIVGIVGNDGGWNQIKVPHAAMYGADRVVAADLGYVRYDRMVEGLGGFGEWVDQPDQIRPALDRAADSGVPALVNVQIQSVFRETSVYGV